MAVTAKDILATFESAVPGDVFKTMDPERPMLEQGLDSLSLAAMAVALQNVYKVKVTVEDGLQLKTVNDVVDFVNRKTKGA